MRREINSKMLKKGQQKPSTRVYNGVIMRERMEYKGHHHVQKPWTFCKARIVSELTLTPFRRALTKSRFELIFGHSPQTLITRIVRKVYPRNPKHIRNKLRCDRKERTSNTSEKLRYRMIDSVHVRVKLLDKHGRTSDRDITQ